MAPNNNNYFVIIIRSFFFQPCFLSGNTDFPAFFFPAFSLLLIEPMILQTIYIIWTCICSAWAPFIEAIYSNIVINSLIFRFIHAICNHFGNFYFLHGIGIGVFSPFSIQ